MRKHVYLCSKFICNYVKVNLTIFLKFLWPSFKFYQVFHNIFSKYWSRWFLLGLDFIILRFLSSNVPKFNFEIPQIFYRLSPNLIGSLRPVRTTTFIFLSYELVNLFLMDLMVWLETRHRLPSILHKCGESTPHSS